MAKPKKIALISEDGSVKGTKKDGLVVKKSSGKGSSGLSLSDLNTVLQYLKSQNRPYSTNDIFSNLHNAIGKTAIQKVLDKLVTDGEAVEKVYGKQSVYVIKQDDAEAPSQEELDVMDAEINTLKEQSQKLKEEWRLMSFEINKLQSTLTLNEMTSQIRRYKNENNILLDKIRDLESGTKKVNPDEKKKVDSLYDDHFKLWKGRKKLCMDIVNMITENMSMKPKEFMAEAELEDDPA